MPITTPLRAALAPTSSAPSPYDTSQSVQPRQPYGEFGLDTNSSAPLGVGQTPASAALTSPAPATTPPPSAPAAPAPSAPASTPAATPAPATAVGGVQIGDYTADPILVRTKALSQQAVADATAAASAATKNLLTQYGHTPGTDSSLYPDANTLQAAEQNPFSTLANLDYAHTQRTRAIDEGTNNANLWYSGEHARELGDESHQYLGEQSSASAALQQALTAIRAGVLGAQRGADQQNLSAEEAAMERAIEYALKYGGNGSGQGAGFPVAGSDTPGLTPGAPIVGLPPGISIPGTTPTAGNPAGIPQPGTPGGGPAQTILSPGQPGYGQLPSSATRAALVAGGGTTSLVNAPYADDARTTQSASGGTTPTDPIAAQATAAGGATYGLVRNSSSLPGNVAPSGVAQAALYNADDPLAQQNVAASPGSGFWVPTHSGETAAQYAARVNALKAANPGATIMLDIEGEGKGVPGSPGYQFTADVMAATGGGNYSVTVPGGGEDDFNYEPFIQSGSMIWIQTYGATANDLMDPQQRYQMMLDRGVPANQIGLMLMPGQTPVPGVPYSYYTLDDMQGHYPTAPAPAPTGTSSFKTTTAPSITPEQALTILGASPSALVNAPATTSPTQLAAALAAALAPTSSGGRTYAI